MFSRVSRFLHVFSSGFDWLTGFSVSTVIGQSGYFRFGATTLNLQPLKVVKWPNVVNYWFEFGLKWSFCRVNNSALRRKSSVAKYTIQTSVVRSTIHRNGYSWPLCPTPEFCFGFCSTPLKSVFRKQNNEYPKTQQYKHNTQDLDSASQQTCLM